MQKRKQKVEQDGQQGCGDGAGKDHIGVIEGDAAEDKFSEPSRGDISSKRGHAHGDNGCCANTGHDNREGQYQVYPEQALGGCHSHGNGGLSDTGVYAVNAGIGIADDRQQGIEEKRGDSGQRADAQ